MTDPTAVAQLKPFLSLLVARKAAGAPNPLCRRVLDDVEDAIIVDGRTRLGGRPPQLADGLRAGFLHYRHTPLVAWATTGLTNTEHHLALVCEQGDHVALYFSEPFARRKIERLLGDAAAGDGLRHLRRVAPGRLNAAFINGVARTLWLSGLHRKSSLKADTKVLSGENLRDALHPLEDQTYAFSAVRSVSPTLEVTVGVAPRKSSLWIGPSESWEYFRDMLLALLGELAGAGDNPAPLPVLAVASSSAAGLTGAFDVSFQPPQLLTHDFAALDPGDLAELERWAEGAIFEITNTNGADFDATLWMWYETEHRTVVDISFVFDLSDPAHVTWTADVQEEYDGVPQADLAAAAAHCKQRDWLVVRYDSGHVLNTGTLFQVRHRDFPFPDWKWVDLSGYDISAEKPDPIDDIGNQDSLFCWVQQCWPPAAIAPTVVSQRGGWLACDDGAGETADFVHLDLGTVPPTLSLIHVKASKETAANRRVSVSAYEIVTGQAVKNLRHVDNDLLAQSLTASLGHKIANLVWRNRAPSNRNNMLAALNALGANYQRRVVVLQPRLRKQAHDHARSHPGSQNAGRLTQLDTLLVAARANANAVGAEFLVIGEDA